MGFLSNLKNNLTGKWADVTVRADPARRGETLTLTVDVSVRDTDIQANKIVAKVQCIERVEVRVRRSAGHNDDGPSFSSSDSESQQATLFEQEVVLAGGQSLSAGSAQSFTGEMHLPPNVPPTFTGRNARVQWRVMGSVDMKGNDPDSGWQPLMID